LIAGLDSALFLIGMKKREIFRQTGIAVNTPAIWEYSAFRSLLLFDSAATAYSGGELDTLQPARTAVQYHWILGNVSFILQYALSRVWVQKGEIVAFYRVEKADALEWLTSNKCNIFF
jgi:hypothetical protein